MYQGNWTCAECGAAITELPFQPDPARLGTLKCRNCMPERRPRPMGERRMYAGNWTCSQCGNAITELPFQPDPSRATNIQCRDCYRSGRM